MKRDCPSFIVPVTVLAVALMVTAAIATAATKKQVELDGELTCVPTLPYFCSNIHIGCAGQSTIRTSSFTLSVIGDRGDMTAHQGYATSGTKRREGTVVRSDDHDSFVLFLLPAKDYVKVSSTGRFNFRYYTGHEALMTYGWCTNASG